MLTDMGCEILTQRLLLDDFQVGGIVEKNPVTGKPSIVFFPISRVSTRSKMRAGGQS